MRTRAAVKAIGRLLVGRWLQASVMVGFLAWVGLAPAQGQLVPLTEPLVRQLLPEIEVSRSTARPGWLVLGTFRTPEVQPRGSGFQLILYWNGIDDQSWPATRIVEVLAAPVCGPDRWGMMEGLLGRLYETRSLIPERDLGGNGGTTFRKRLIDDIGSCKVEIVADGARWHTVTFTVRR